MNKSVNERNMSNISNERAEEGENAAAIQEVPLNTFFEILANTHRRQLLFSLLEYDYLDDDHPHVPTDVSSTDERERQLSLRMTHIHLPMLSAADVIEWNWDENTVWRGPRFEDIRPLVRMVQEQADERSMNSSGNDGTNSP
ncbi:hypothetical protein [Haladaptatus paucihalophilus]|uniref:ArsR family transcriptional regulator n=2 Tax=Haladaptatus paucihalophilus DX253 TaxID=797209 RepID=A0A1M6XZR6_HALPU|nr:hypothetical protein [Haladaptatus paucihalophilus]SHL11491.1 hypothetical protein SAMN05444342_3071 [Haladaptatus paucihalophilus DX253]